MFTNCYQSGLYIELFSRQNKDLKKNWKFSGKIINEYDQLVKTYVTNLITGGASKMQSPKSDKESLGIVQSYIVFQLYIFSVKSFGIEISISDTSKTKRRIMFSTSSKEIIINPLHCRVPLPNLPMNKWLNISIDVLSFVSECFNTLTFRSIDFISMSGSCKVRKIFTMRNGLPDENSNNFLFIDKNDNYINDNYEVVPKAMNFPHDLVYENINVNHEKLKTSILMINNGNINNVIVNSNNKNGNIQSTINIQNSKPISLTQPVTSHHIQNKENFSNDNVKQISSFSQNFQINTNDIALNSNRDIIESSKSNKVVMKSEKTKLPKLSENYTKNIKIKNEIKVKSPKMENRAIKLPPIGIVKNNTRSQDKKVNKTRVVLKEKIQTNQIKIKSEVEGGMKLERNDFLGKWENKENDEFEEFEKKAGVEKRNVKNIEEEKKKPILISENISSIHEQESFEKVDKYYDIPIKKPIEEKGNKMMQKGKDNFLLSNNNLFEIKEDKKLIRHEIFKDNSENDKLNNFDENRQFTPPFSIINTNT